MKLTRETERKYPGVGLMLTLGSGLVFWGTVAYVFFG